MDIKLKVLASAKAVTRDATVYSNSIELKAQTGVNSVLITSTAGSITVTQQVSVDGSTFYDVENKNGVSLGEVVSAMLVGTKYIAFEPAFGLYIRFKIVEADVAATAVTVTYLYQETLI